ncbi:MAG: hypothetical protein COB15_06685 [Flavobacteriales bacterium]|nr:MAG: hypothetical protein COB15_06685 [Flavobacteriales bacterium]
MKKITYLVLTASLLTSTTLISQNNSVAQPELDSGTIEQQFDYIITKSTSYKEFQLIRKSSILKIKAHTLDSLKKIQKDLVAVTSSTSKTKANISQLETEVTTLKNEIETISKDVDSISFLGAPLSKASYNSVVWLIIGLLLLGLLIFVGLYKKCNISTVRAQNDLEKINNEFETFRKKALTKEQETMRKLQDELNKNHS